MARENVTVMVELPIIRQWFATNKAMVLSLDSFTVSLYIYIYIFFFRFDIQVVVTHLFGEFLSIVRYA